MGGLKDFITDLIGEEQAPEFAKWAFGEGFEKLNGMELFAEAWNERHKELYEIELHNEIHRDILKMVKLWEQINE